MSLFKYKEACHILNYQNETWRAVQFKDMRATLLCVNKEIISWVSFPNVVGSCLYVDGPKDCLWYFRRVAMEK